MIAVLILLLLASVSASGQPGIPIFLGPVVSFLPPAVDATGRTIAFASSVDPQGVVGDTTDLYAGAAKLASSVTSVGLTSDGSRVVFTDMVAGGEGVGMIDRATGAVRRLSVDTQGCIRPLAVCFACVFACVATPHATPDRTKVLYAVRRNQPFYTVNADGTGLTQLPVYTGGLAPAPQRVISSNGQVVFTSSAPFGPTFAASATDVYLMNLDGSNIRNLTKFGNNGSIFSSNATLSADGNTILFETNSAAPPLQQNQIWAVQADGGNLRQLTSGPDAATNPSISADGKAAVFIQSGRLKLLQLTGNARMIVSFQSSVVQSPVISDDGQRVAFLLGPASGSAGAVYEVNTDGTGLRAVYAPRAINPRGVVSAAALGLPLSPGSLFSVYGLNLAPDGLTAAGGFPLPGTLAGASVLADGTPLPLLSVSPWQINAQLPQETPAQNVNFQVAFADGAKTAPEPATVVTAAPGLFVFSFQNGIATFLQAAAFHAGTAILADDDHPAQAGEVLEMYGTGLGATHPPVSAGQPSPADPVAQAVLTPAVSIGRAPAQVLFAGLTPGLAGVYQVNIVVPAGLKPGRYAVLLQSGEPNTGSLAIK